MTDHMFIEALEGFKTVAYVPRDRRKVPLGKSGATIGAGVDLGQWSEAQLVRRLGPDPMIALLRPYLGLRGWDAVRALEAAPLTLTERQARALTKSIRRDLEEALVSMYDKAAKRLGGLRWAVLPGSCQTVVMSVAYQYGPMLVRETPNFWAQVTAGRWADAHKNLLDFKDDYPTRRRKEAEHLAPVLVP